MSMPVAIGETLAGKYRIERVLGEGGMGVVVAATHLQLEQVVAIKFLLAAAVKNEELVARFAREARVLAKLEGEHVGRVIDVGQTDDGSPYMVMEYLDGRDLEKELEARGALPIAEAVDYVLQAIEAIAEAHNHGIVHRDLKPANLFLAKKTNGGTSVKVLDFGISKDTKQDVRESGLTKASAVMGSPLYMPPEQLSRASDADQRSDVWSLGVILYELTTTKLPFEGDSMPQLLTAVLHGKPTALLTARPDAPPGLATIIERCLEKDPARRYQDVAGLARALGPYGNQRAALSVERIHAALPFAFPPTVPPTRQSEERISVDVPSLGGFPRNAAFASTAASSMAPEKLARQAATLKMRVEKKPRPGMYAALGGAGAVLLIAGVVTQRHVSSAASSAGAVDAGRIEGPSTSSSATAAPTASATGAPSDSAAPNSLPVPSPSSPSPASPAASGSAAISPRPARSAPPRANMPGSSTPPPAPSHDSHWTPALK